MSQPKEYKCLPEQEHLFIDNEVLPIAMTSRFRKEKWGKTNVVVDYGNWADVLAKTQEENNILAFIPQRFDKMLAKTVTSVRIRQLQGLRPPPVVMFRICVSTVRFIGLASRPISSIHMRINPWTR